MHMYKVKGTWMNLKLIYSNTTWARIRCHIVILCPPEGYDCTDDYHWDVDHDGWWQGTRVGANLLKPLNDPRLSFSQDSAVNMDEASRYNMVTCGRNDIFGSHTSNASNGRWPYFVLSFLVNNCVILAPVGCWPCRKSFALFHRFIHSIFLSFLILSLCFSFFIPLSFFLYSSFFLSFFLSIFLSFFLSFCVFFPYYFIHFVYFIIVFFLSISLYLFSFYFMLFHFMWFHLFILFHFISFHFIWFYFMSFYFISFDFHFMVFHVISLHSISLYFMSCYFFHVILFDFILVHFASFHFFHSCFHEDTH